MSAIIQGRTYKRRVTTVPTYFVDGVKVEFWPVSDVPHFSHRVRVADKTVGWLGDHMNPSAKVAVFFYEKREDETVTSAIRQIRDDSNVDAR